MAEDLPESWTNARLEDLIIFALGGDWGKAPDHDDPEYVHVRCIRASEISDWDTQKGSTAALRRVKSRSLESRELREGDIIVEISGGGPEQPVGRTVLIDRAALAVDPDTPKICTNFFRLARPANDISSAYLNLYLQHFHATGRVRAYQGGSNNLRNLKFAEYLTITIPIPPKCEQDRIVAKLDELLSELDRGIESLQTARAQLEVYRHALFKYAFEGQLTTEWRERLDGDIESVDALLSRVSRLRNTQEQEQLAAWTMAVEEWKERGERGPKPSKPRRFKPLEPFDQDEMAALPTLPDGWRYVRLAEIAQIGSGMSVSSRRKVEDPVEVPYLRVANVQRGHLVLDEIKTMTIERSHLPRLHLSRWDVLFNEGGDRDKLGRGWIWCCQAEPCITQNHVFRASPVLSSELHSKWISYWGNSFGQRYFNSEGKQTTNLASINKTVLSRFPVPLPSVREQEAIVQLLEEKITVVDHLDQEIGIALAQLDALRQATLKRAFAGGLVDHDPSDEPASALLERIQAERDAEGNRSNTRKAAS